MRMTTLAVALLGISASLLQATSALAQTPLLQTRSWVSVSGSGSNACSRNAPCLTFAGALSKTEDSGIINCLDSGTFNIGSMALTINKSIQIDCLNVHAGVLTINGNAININTAGVKVVLRGLSIDSLGAGLVGINITAGATVHIEKSTIRGFRAGNASALRISNTNGIAKLYISDSHITDNGTGSAGGGIMTVPTGSGFSLVELRNMNVKENTFGVGNTANSRMRISHASLAGNTVGVVADVGAVVTLNDVDIVYSNTGISGATTSFGNNRIAGNNSDGTPPTPAGAQSHELGQR